MSTTHKYTNQLIHAKSTYLLQHAHNPVNWYPWCDEAFEKAKREDKMVLISIGYSACHWCHVMERECFEQEDTAALMNAHFVCIKVDREERPDVDQLYMDAVQLLTGQGGWPLNCFTLPDGRPVHGGTYFPKQEWERVLKSLADFYLHKREEAMQYATELTNGIKKLDILPKPDNDDLLGREALNQLVLKWSTNIDSIYGGYSWAPKFPMPTNWNFFLQHAHLTKNNELLNEVVFTLTKMAEGGIYDQLGGGFARYSTDSYWKVPHFEKMLYDNAQLISLYAAAYQKTKAPIFAKVVHQTIHFVLDELTAPEGYFYSALDADSEGVEGKYYLWTKLELQQILGDDEPLFSLYYSIDAYGNWEHQSNILYKTRTDEELEQLTGKSIETIEAVIAACNQILLKQRRKRIAPGLDDKMICSWNALMIEALADAYLTFGNELYLTQAKRAASFMLRELFDGKALNRIYKNGSAEVNGFAEDYAFMCSAWIKLYEASGIESYVIQAQQFMELAIHHFYDEQKQLFYFKSKEDAPLITRKIDLNDDVIPSANAVLCKCLWQLGFLYSREDYHYKAKQMIIRVQHKFTKFTSGYTHWMMVLQWMHDGYYQIVVSGNEANGAHLNAYQIYIPNKLVCPITQKSAIPLLQDKSVTPQTTYYLCKDKSCGLPQYKWEPIEQQL